MSRLAAPPRPAARMSGRIRHVETPLRPVPRGDHYTEFEAEDGRRVFVHRDVLTELAALERDEHPNESAGLLFGRTFTDGANECALVRHLIRPAAGEVIGSAVTVTITAEGSNRMSQRAQDRFPCADAVGWAHTHPTFGAYFSGTDRAEQAIWTSPASVGLVVSGLPDADPPFEVFVGPDSTPTRLASPLAWKTPPPPPEDDAWPRRRGITQELPGRAPAGPPAGPPVSRAGVGVPAAGRRLGHLPHETRPRPRRGRPRWSPGGTAALRLALTIAAAVLVALLIWLLSQWVSGSRSDPGSTGTAPSGRLAVPPPGEVVAGVRVLRQLSVLVDAFDQGVSEIIAAPGWGSSGMPGGGK